MIEEVKKLLREEKDRVLAYDFSLVDRDSFAQQICQLFEPKFNNALEADAHNWDTRELLGPKPDEGRLLSWERIRMVFQEQNKKGQHDNMFIMEALCQEQRDLTASIKDAECQARVEGILKWGKERCIHHCPEDRGVYSSYGWICKHQCSKCWQALKKKELK